MRPLGKVAQHPPTEAHPHPYNKGTFNTRPMTTTTYHTYADLIIDGGRHAATEWGYGATLAEAVAATLRLDADAIILRAVRGTEVVRGYAPAGMVA